MDQKLKNRFSVSPGYNHERDGIPIPQPVKFHYVLLLADIVMDSGTIEAVDEAHAEQLLIQEIAPNHPHTNYMLNREITEDEKPMAAKIAQQLKVTDEILKQRNK
jgi:hypothetical protein